MYSYVVRIIDKHIYIYEPWFCGRLLGFRRVLILPIIYFKEIVMNKFAAG